ncbi:MAG: DUF1800 domain-containing protein [Vicinamibacterales bacterium]|nr:DUF1800 domain-containing protein [Vicinamibacterales bacterium]
MSDHLVQHLLRRAGFGSSPEELAFYSQLSYGSAVDALLNYEQFADDVDSRIGTPGYAGVTSAGEFLPNSNIAHARQRWAFRMVHSKRPLQEKMTLFWHNHFATGYTKVRGVSPDGARLMAAKASEDAGGQQGQIEMLRSRALGNFRDLLTEVSKDPAMTIWLDGYTNTKNKPQENFAREIMELFTMGVGNYTESDVYAGAKVFTGWTFTTSGDRQGGTGTTSFAFNANQHDTSAKTFSFSIYPDGGKTIQPRSAQSGMQDGLDLITALAGNPNTARYLAKKLIRFFVSELSEPDPGLVNTLANTYLASGYSMKLVMRELLMSSQFTDTAAYFSRYAWPVEFVARAIKEVGWAGYSLNDAVTALGNMGQVLYEPPDVAGWDLGPNWFSSGTMLARMNLGSTLAANQKFNLRDAARPYGKTSDALLSWMLDRMPLAPYNSGTYDELRNFLNATKWTGSDSQLLVKASGLAHIILATPQYQFV